MQRVWSCCWQLGSATLTAAIVLWSMIGLASRSHEHETLSDINVKNLKRYGNLFSSESIVDRNSELGSFGPAKGIGRKSLFETKKQSQKWQD